MQRPPLIIISGPSGAGEDSVIEGLRKILPIERVTTTTTRAMRPNESQGRPYYFVSKEDFEKGIAEKKFFEYAKQYNNEYYGVTFDEIERVKMSGKIGIWKIDYQGVASAKKLLPGIIAIFITVPLDILEQRIRRRSNVTEAYVRDRMAYTKEWMKHTDLYDYTVVNEEGKLDTTVADVKRIIEEQTAA